LGAYQGSPIRLVTAPGSESSVMTLSVQNLLSLPLILTPIGLRVLAWNSMHESEDPPRWPAALGATLFSGRGYIWSRSLTLLKDHILLGAGPGVFPFTFP